MTKAALGGEIEVPTIDGSRAKVKIPEGTQTGKQMRLRTKGMTLLYEDGLEKARQGLTTVSEVFRVIQSEE